MPSSSSSLGRNLASLLAVAVCCCLMAEPVQPKAWSFFQNWATFMRRGADLSITLNAVQHVVPEPVYYVRCASNNLTSECRPKSQGCIGSEVQIPLDGFYLTELACENALRDTDLFDEIPRTQQQAIDAVLQRGLVVASLLTPQEFNNVIVLMLSRNVEIAWMGFKAEAGSSSRRKRSVSEVFWLRASTGDLVLSNSSALNWTTGEPNRANGDCVVVNSTAPSGLQMYPCDAQLNVTIVFSYVPEANVTAPATAAPTTAAATTVAAPVTDPATTAVVSTEAPDTTAAVSTVAPDTTTDVFQSGSGSGFDA